MDELTFATLHRAFLNHLVLFLPQNETLTPHHLMAFASHFGKVDAAPFVHPIKMPSEEGHPEVFNVVKEADHGAVNVGGSGTLMSPIAKGRTWERCSTQKKHRNSAATRCSPISIWPTRHYPKT